jgi:hypothetical protein
MKQQRRIFLKGLASSAGVLLAGCSQTEPPTYGNVLRMGDLLTYKAHRLLLPAHSLAREYESSDISSRAGHRHDESRRSRQVPPTSKEENGSA